MSAEKPRIVLDCMVCLQAVAREESAAATCLRLAENHHVQLFISRAIIKEVEDVLSRDYVRVRFPWATEGISFSDVINGMLQDELDSVAEHYGVFREGRLVAAARLSVHAEFSSVPLPPELVSATLPLTPIAFLSRLVVDLPARGQGLGNALVEHLVARASELDTPTQSCPI